MSDIWQDITNNGVVIQNPKYFSIYGKSGQNQFTKNNPGAWNEVPNSISAILGCGLFYMERKHTAYVFGQGMHKTYLRSVSSDLSGAQQISNLTLLPDNDSGTLAFYAATWRNISCDCPLSITISGAMYNCLFTNTVTVVYSGKLFLNCCIANNEITSTKLLNVFNNASNTVFHKCKVYINSSSTETNYFNVRRLYNDCVFQIGNEVEPTALVGETIAELKQNFFDRCNAQGFTDAQTNLSKWEFSKDSVDNEFAVITSSEAAQFANNLGFYWGYLQKSNKGLKISASIAPQSINNIEGKSNNVEVKDSLITTKTTDTTSNYWNAEKQSSILCYNNLFKVKQIPLRELLPYQIQASIGRNVVPLNGDRFIELDCNYLVRSSNAIEASVTYNGVVYSSKLANNKYIFRGTAETQYTKSDNAIVYKVSSYENSDVIGIRATNQVQELNVNKVIAGYWYYVSPNDLQSNAGHVVYNGNTYPSGSSFLGVDGVSDFKAVDCQLDKVFIDDEQQNPFIKVHTINPTFISSGIGGTDYVIGKDGKIIGSAHEEYSSYINQGYLVQNIQGRAMQLKVGLLKRFI